jgi:DNA-binding transcriptional LysR family regulator
MEFHQLRYFTTAAEEMNFSRAAERLHVTQPALSRQIAALEADLGVALFHRAKQRVTLTDAGRFFLPKARQIICDAQTAVQQTREQFGDAPKTLRLGFLPIFLDDMVAPAMKEFRQRHPKAQVSLFELSPRAQLDRLRAHELDAAILGNLEEADKAEFIIKRLARHRMAAILSVDHPLAQKRSIKLSALARDGWVSLSDAFFPGRRDFLRRICAKAGFEPNVTHEVDSLSLLLAEVSAGGGVAILPEHTQKLPHTGCVFVNLAAPVPTTDLFLVLPRRAPGKEMSTLASLIIEQSAQLP